VTASTAIDIHDATAADLDALVELAVGLRDHLRQSTPTAAALRDGFVRLLADDAARFVVARDADGAALGYVQCRYRFSAWTGGSDVELEDVFVADAARRRGVGRQLVAAALAQARRAGCRTAVLTTNERNAAALALYRSLGFAAERPRWEGGRQLWLECRLAAA